MHTIHSVSCLEPRPSIKAKVAGKNEILRSSKEFQVNVDGYVRTFKAITDSKKEYVLGMNLAISNMQSSANVVQSLKDLHSSLLPRACDFERKEHNNSRRSKGSKKEK